MKESLEPIATVVTHRLHHWILLAVLTLMWGSAFMFTKIAVTSLPPVTVVAGRILLAGLLLVLLLLVLRKRLPGLGRLWLFFFSIAVLGNCLPFYLITWGQQRIDSGLAGILMAIIPIATLVLAHFFVQGERVTLLKAFGFVLSFIGILVLMGGPSISSAELVSDRDLVAELAVLGGALCYAVSTIIARRRPRSDPIESATGVLLIAGAIMLIGASASGNTWVPALPVSAISAVVVLGVFSTALATVTYFKLLSLAGPTFVSLINYLIPLWAVAAGILFLGEEPRWTDLLALVFVLVGIAFTQLDHWRSTVRLKS